MTSQQSNYTISVMSRAELQIAINWASAEGWNPGVDDGEVFQEADVNGFIMGKLNNRPISSISAVRYGESFGFIGLYITEKEFRHQGYGIQVWKRALEYLKGRNVGLDGVLAQQDNYKKSGFRLAYRNIRFAGKAKEANLSSANLVNLTTIALSDLCEYDRQFFPEERHNFINTWIKQPHAHAWGIVDNKKLVAYGVIRACQVGYKIGPLNAENKDLASQLFHALVSHVPVGSDIFLDVPEPNTMALELAQQNEMKPSFETARMYTGEFPNISLDKTFGVTTFELG